MAVLEFLSFLVGISEVDTHGVGMDMGLKYGWFPKGFCLLT